MAFSKETHDCSIKEPVLSGLMLYANEELQGPVILLHQGENSLNIEFKPEANEMHDKLSQSCLYFTLQRTSISGVHEFRSQSGPHVMINSSTVGYELSHTLSAGDVIQFNEASYLYVTKNYPGNIKSPNKADRRKFEKSGYHSARKEVVRAQLDDIRCYLESGGKDVAYIKQCASDKAVNMDNNDSTPTINLRSYINGSYDDSLVTSVSELPPSGRGHSCGNRYVIPHHRSSSAAPHWDHDNRYVIPQRRFSAPHWQMRKRAYRHCAKSKYQSISTCTENSSMLLNDIEVPNNSDKCSAMTEVCMVQNYYDLVYQCEAKLSEFEILLNEYTDLVKQERTELFKQTHSSETHCRSRSNFINDDLIEKLFNPLLSSDPNMINDNPEEPVSCFSESSPVLGSEQLGWKNSCNDPKLSDIAGTSNDFELHQGLSSLGHCSVAFFGSNSHPIMRLSLIGSALERTNCVPLECRHGYCMLRVDNRVCAFTCYYVCPLYYAVA